MKIVSKGKGLGMWSEIDGLGSFEYSPNKRNLFIKLDIDGGKYQFVIVLDRGEIRRMAQAIT